MITFQQIRIWVRNRISQENLTRIIIIMALLTGMVAGYVWSGKFIEKECNEFIIDNFIIPDLEELGFVFDEERKILSKPISDEIANFSFDLAFQDDIFEVE